MLTTSQDGRTDRLTDWLTERLNPERSYALVYTGRPVCCGQSETDMQFCSIPWNTNCFLIELAYPISVITLPCLIWHHRGPWFQGRQGVRSSQGAMSPLRVTVHPNLRVSSRGLVASLQHSVGRRAYVGLTGVELCQRLTGWQRTSVHMVHRLIQGLQTRAYGTHYLSHYKLALRLNKTYNRIGLH